MIAVRENDRIEFTFEASHFKPGFAFAPDEHKPARGSEFGVAVGF